MVDVTDHLGLAYNEAKRIYKLVKNKYEFEDLVQIADMGLINAAKNFDENKGFKFSTFATPCIRGYLYRFISRDKKYNITQGIPHNFSIISYEYEYETGSLNEKIGSNEFEDELIKNIQLKNVIENLDENKKQLIKLYYFEDKNQPQIAKILNTTQVQVSRNLKKILNEMKRAIEEPTKVTSIAM